MSDADVERVVDELQRALPEQLSRPFSFEIGGRRVGDGAPAYVIAEAGANHNRDLGMARKH